MTADNKGVATEKPTKVGKWEKFVMMKPLQWSVGIIGTVGLFTSGWRAVSDGNTTPVLIVSAVLLGVALIGDKVKEVNLATGEHKLQLILFRSAFEDVAENAGEAKEDPKAFEARMKSWAELLTKASSERTSGMVDTWMSLNEWPIHKLKPPIDPETGKN